MKHKIIKRIELGKYPQQFFRETRKKKVTERESIVFV